MQSKHGRNPILVQGAGEKHIVLSSMNIKYAVLKNIEKCLQIKTVP